VVPQPRSKRLGRNTAIRSAAIRALAARRFGFAKPFHIVFLPLAHIHRAHTYLMPLCGGRSKDRPPHVSYFKYSSTIRLFVDRRRLHVLHAWQSHDRELELLAILLEPGTNSCFAQRCALPAPWRSGAFVLDRDFLAHAADSTDVDLLPVDLDVAVEDDLPGWARDDASPERQCDVIEAALQA